MKSVLHKLSLVTLICCATVIPAVAQSNQQSAESVAIAYLEAVIKTDWAKLAEMMHPDALKIVRNFADKLVAMEGKQSDKNFEKEVFGVSKENYSKLTDQQVYAGLLEFYIKDQAVSEMLGNTTYTLLGQVAEGGEITHAVFRMQTTEKKANDTTFQFLNMSYSVADIISLKRHENTWKTMLSPAFEAMIAARLNVIAMVEELRKADKSEPETSTDVPKSKAAESSSAKPETKKPVSPSRKRKPIPNS